MLERNKKKKKGKKEKKKEMTSKGSEKISFFQIRIPRSVRYISDQHKKYSWLKRKQTNEKGIL